MLLKNLINNLPEKKKIRISGLSTDSKKVKPGHIFFAIKGSNNNGEKFIKEAINKGASVIVCSRSTHNQSNPASAIISAIDGLFRVNQDPSE